MTRSGATKWQDYEEVARYLLNQIGSEFGLARVEGKQVVDSTQSGTAWEIDAKGVTENGEGFFLIECRRYTTHRLDQEAAAAIAYRVRDTGASGGIIVTPLGFQEGAAKVAAAENLYSVLLNPNCTTTEYIMRFLNTVMIGVQPEALTVSTQIVSMTVEEVDPEE
jgi:hypothetical protein